MQAMLHTRTLGVCWYNGKWRAAISFQNCTRNLGNFAAEEEAARAYDAAAKKLRKNPVLNFLHDGALNPDRKGLSGRPSPQQAHVAAGAAAGSGGGGGASPSALPEYGQALVDSILSILDQPPSPPRPAPPAGAAAPAAPAAVAPAFTSFDALLAAIPRFGRDPVAALQSYATFCYVDLDLDDPTTQHYAAALQLLARVSGSVVGWCWLAFGRGGGSRGGED